MSCGITYPLRRYGLDAGHTGDPIGLTVALAPLVLGYDEIGERLARRVDGPRPADRIATYPGTEYQRTCREIDALSTRQSSAASGQILRTALDSDARATGSRRRPGLRSTSGTWA